MQCLCIAQLCAACVDDLEAERLRNLRGKGKAPEPKEDEKEEDEDEDDEDVVCCTGVAAAGLAAIILACLQCPGVCGPLLCSAYESPHS